MKSKQTKKNYTHSLFLSLSLSHTHMQTHTHTHTHTHTYIYIYIANWKLHAFFYKHTSTLYGGTTCIAYAEHE